MLINQTIKGVEVTADITIDESVDLTVYELQLDGIDFTLEQLEYLQHPVLPVLKQIIGINEVVKITKNRYKL